MEKIPSISEFDGWRSSPVGRWFFDVYLQSYADESAKINGKQVGVTEDTKDKEFMTFVRNAGVINGIEFAVSADPFEEEREENQSDRSPGIS